MLEGRPHDCDLSRLFRELGCSISSYNHFSITRALHCFFRVQQGVLDRDLHLPRLTRTHSLTSLLNMVRTHHVFALSVTWSLGTRLEWRYLLPIQMQVILVLLEVAFHETIDLCLSGVNLTRILKHRELLLGPCFFNGVEAQIFDQHFLLRRLRDIFHEHLELVLQNLGLVLLLDRTDACIGVVCNARAQPRV